MRRALMAAALFCTCAAARGGGEWTAPAPAPAAGARYRRGLELKASRRYGEALEELRAAVALSPGDIRVHREYQNLMLDLGRQEELVRDYGAARRRAPGDAAAAYLYGRLLDDPVHQEREFRRAIGLDPRSPWGHYGLAVILLGRGDKAGAEGEIAGALERAPSLMQAGEARAMLDSIAGRHERALDRYRGLCRNPDATAGLFAAALGECRLLGRDGDGASVSADAVSRFPGCPALEEWRGWFLARTGDRAGALAWYEKASRAGPLPFVFAAQMRRLCAESGLHGRAVGLWRGLFGTQLLSPDNRLLPLWRLVEERARAVSGGSGREALAALAEAYEGMGWWAEAAAAREAAGERASGGGALAADLRGAELLNALERYGMRLDERVRAGSPRVTLPSAVRELAAAVGEEEGRPLVAPGAVRSIAGVRWFGDAPGRPQPLIDRLRGGNREIIFFENAARGRIGFEIAELIRCAIGRDGPGEPLHWEATCCPSGIGVTEGESGLAYPPFRSLAIFYDPSRWSDMCDARRTPWSDPLGHSWFMEETGGAPLGPLDVAYSRMLEKRLFEKACRSAGGGTIEAAIEDRYAGIVAAHERRHLRDLRRFLPVGRHPARCLGLAAGALFSPRRIERWFEERAIAAGVIDGGDPEIWLLTAQMQLAGEAGAHGDAGRRVLERLVRCIASDPAAFPEMDCRRNILNQLYLLDGERIREVVRELYGGME